MMKHWLAGLVAGIASIVTVAPAAATVVGGEVTGGTALAVGGRFVKLLPPLPNPFGLPDSVGNDNFQSPNLFAFGEDQNILLTAPLVIDVGSGPLSAGTIVASHYVFFDPGPSQHVVGTVEFDAPVLGIITATANLANSDFLANTGVTYLSPGQRGLEAGDSVSFSGTNRILFDTFASSPGDYVRADGLLARRHSEAGHARVAEPGLGGGINMATWRVVGFGFDMGGYAHHLFVAEIALELFVWSASAHAIEI